MNDTGNQRGAGHLVRVTRKWPEAEDIFAFELRDASGRALPEFSPGSHIDVHVPGGLVRQYSLARPYATDGSYEIGVLREPESRGGSKALCDRLQEGDTLGISEPRNHFPLRSARHSILLAGGIGITPVLCMAEHLAASGASLELHYCSRTPARMAYRNRIAASTFADRAFLHFDDGDPSQKLDPDATLGNPAADKHIYVCGPAGFLEFVRARARSKGWDDANVHFEYFAPPADHTEVVSSGFEVVVASTGVSVAVGAEESVVAALARAGVDIPVMCEQGVCGSCLTRVIEGTPDHRDYVLSGAERAMNDQFLPCCSRSLSARLVLDI